MEDAFHRADATLRSGLPLSAPGQKDIQALEEYYQTSWLSDFEADERGELPDDLRRGVLSEDALYDLLHEADERQKQK